MARITQGFEFTGTLGNVTAYRMRGHDQVILRSKGGAKKSKIKRSPAFDKTRRLNAEFGGRANASSRIMDILHTIKPVADYNIAGPLNALIKPIQMLDTTSEFGKRSITFTKQPGLLEGFQLNKRFPFDQLITNPLVFSISKKDCTACVEIPALIPGINFFVPENFSYVGFTFVLGTLSDLVFDKSGYKPVSKNTYTQRESVDSDWYAVSKQLPPQSFDIKLPGVVPDDTICILLAAAIRFGRPMNRGIEPIKYVGAGKVLRVV